MTTAAAPALPNALREQLTATDKRIEIIPLDALNKRGLQLREETNTDAVARYAEAYKAGESLPPIVVFRDPTEDVLHLADGHHRVAAAKRAQLTEIHALVKKGDRRAAILYGASANGTHGLALTNADKRKIVGILLADEEWKTWSNHEVARNARVSEAFVRSVRRELKAEVETIKRKDGTTQKPRNAAAKKPRQQSLLDPLADEKAMIADTWQRVQSIAELSHLHPIKCRMLVALYWYGATGDTPMKREILAEHIDDPVDGHAAGLRTIEWAHQCDHDGPAYFLTDSRREALRQVLEPAAVPPAPATTPPEDATLPPRSPTFDPMGPTDDPDDWQHIARRARLAIEAADLTIAGYAEKHGLSYAYLAELLATGEAPINDDQAGKLYDAFPVIPAAPAATGPEDLSATAADIADPGKRILIPAPDTLTATAPPTTPAEQRPEPAPRSLELRRVDKAREILQHRLLTGKPQWKGRDEDLFLLGLIAGVPTRTVAWIDACRAQSRDLYVDALRTEVADRIRSGVAINSRCWPQLPELCRLWGLDFEAFEIEAERAVPA